MKNVTSTGSFLFYCVQNLFININQFDELNFIISLFQASTCFEHMCSSSGGQILYYTASGIITPIGGRPVHRLREDSDVLSWRIGLNLVSAPLGGEFLRI